MKDHLDRKKTTIQTEIEELRLKESTLEEDGDWITGQSQKLEAERRRRALEEKLSNMMKHNKRMEEIKQRVKHKVTI